MKTKEHLITPLGNADRILFLDILRGIAILFIFLANIPYLSGTLFYSSEQAASFPTASLDHGLKVFFFTLIDGKFYSIFSILFGIGFVVQYNSIQRSKRSFVPFFSRRMLGLLLIGGIHLVFVWPGDILTLYALLGFLLIGFREFSNRNLLIWAAVLLIMPIVHWFLMFVTGFYYPGDLFKFVDARAAWVGVASEGAEGYMRYDFMAFISVQDFAQWMKMQVALPVMRLGGLLMEGRFFKVMGLFLIGIWAGRQVLNHNILENTTMLRKIVLWGFVIGVPINVFRAVVEFGWQNSPIWELMYYVFYALGVVPLACGYIAGIALIVIARPHWLEWIAPVGRTALSNYLFQSFIAIFIFYGIGLGYVGRFGFAVVTGIAIVIFIGQVLITTIWLRYFRFGPIEWIWRQLTYGKWIHIRHKSIVQEPVFGKPIL